MSKHGKKKWRDMSRGQRAATIVGSIVQVTLLAAALWDIAHRPESGIKGSKKLWTAAAFVNFAGPIAYFLFGRKKPAPA
ncbi:MAG: PLDc_N domain-containing protein [Actinobacteria bacterium]|nr:PLDc_N domain-containing protein [Actinomycetota bacterium]